MNIFVNDIKIIISKKIGFIKKLKIKLNSKIKILNMIAINFYLSLKLDKNREKKKVKLN